MDWDKDIAEMALSPAEKDGWQVHRNYSRSLERGRYELFKKNMDSLTFESAKLERVSSLIAQEDLRIVPVVVCAYADEVLEAMLRKEIPEDVPGGKQALFGSYGPMSTLSSRVQLAYCFGLVSGDVLHDLNSLRKVRNKISHDWKSDEFMDYIAKEPATTISNVEDFIRDHPNHGGILPDELSVGQRFRIRLAWIMARLTYECLYMPVARRERLNVHMALYGENRLSALSTVSEISMRTTHDILGGQNLETHR